MIQVIPPRYAALAVFALAYLLFIALPKRRTATAAVAVLFALLLGAISLPDAFRSVNWNVIGIFAGMGILSHLFFESRVPAVMAEHIVNQTKNTAWALMGICLMAGFISSFLDNVSTVLIIAPIALAVSSRLKVEPTAMLIGIAVSANLQGTATLIGDPPSMLLAAFAGLNFWEFFFYHGKPAIFFAVELGAVASFIVLWYFFRHFRQKAPPVREEAVLTWRPTVIILLVIAALIASSFSRALFGNTAGLICLIGAAGALVAEQAFGKKEPLLAHLQKIDWETVSFLALVFILVGCLTVNGWTEYLARQIVLLTGNNVLFGFLVLTFFSVAVSAFVDNIPFLAAMLPVAMSLAAKVGVDPSPLLFGLLIGASLGGNITPIGASANVVACGILKKEGYTVSFGQFLRIGLPFTLAAVSAASFFIWLVWIRV
ncbi:MAG: SLC13 family permease [Candidatus Margulisbacteria bacterium]|jgi:Na+/H+ antiporter NhaD/arsenite permease-like protein|nr:SLC13 family permease [Candidatus Margulisiibacteriota bacterium]